ncbi:MAG: hypothetical protein QHC89_21395, partial [Bosea sp. (in: a-proteobacteria)]|nr:hypothetical protein [Bosea sp. (in: a-proteobacteria)]
VDPFRARHFHLKIQLPVEIPTGMVACGFRANHLRTKLVDKLIPISARHLDNQTVAAHRAADRVILI